MIELRFVCVLALAVPACSDDGLPGTQNTGGTGTATGTATTPTTDGGVESANGTGEGTAGPAETGTSGPPPSATEGSTTDASTGEPADSTSDTGMDTENTGGSSTGAETEGCQPITEDASDIGTDCMSDMDCEPGYTCQPFNGFVFEQTCQILCTESCECPMGLTCQFTDDKVNDWFQCV